MKTLDNFRKEIEKEFVLDHFSKLGVASAIIEDFLLMDNLQTSLTTKERKELKNAVTLLEDLYLNS